MFLMPAFITARAFTASASPDILNGEGHSTPVDSPYVSVTTLGGTAPFTYAWEMESGGPMVCVLPTSANTYFRANAMSPGAFRHAAWRCKVTDNAGTIVYTNPISVSLYRDEI